jgi:hypothetical protein
VRECGLRRRLPRELRPVTYRVFKTAGDLRATSVPGRTRDDTSAHSDSDAETGGEQADDP